MNADLQDRTGVVVDGQSAAARSSRRRWARRVVVALAVVLFAAGAVGYPSLVTAVGGSPPRADGPAGVPDRIAGYSYLTGSVSDSLPGRAIAVYQHGFGVETFDFPQALVLGADADVYRRVDAAEDRSGPTDQGDPAPMLLSPDGTRLAIGTHAAAGDLVLLNLAAGRVDTLPARHGASVVPLAWSGDLRYLAALEIPGPTNPHSGQPLGGRLAVFDLHRGGEVARPLPDAGVVQVAFTPDSTQMAVQSTTSLLVTDPAGRVLRTLVPPAGYRLDSAAAWSPDAQLLALGAAGDPAGTASPPTIALLAASGGRDPVLEPVVDAGPALGWSGHGTLLARDASQSRHNTLVEIDLATGSRRILTRLDTGPADNFGIGRLQLATGLLVGLYIRPAGDPSRGPWPTWLRTMTAVVALLTAALAVTTLGRRGRRRRRGSSTR